MALQDSDLLYLERGGTLYQTTWGAIRLRSVAATDLALIYRNGAHYKVEIGTFWDCTTASLPGDFFLVERGLELYHEEILFPCSFRIDVSSASTFTVAIAGGGNPTTGTPAQIVLPDGSTQTIPVGGGTYTFTQNGTYEFSGVLTQFQILGTDGVVDASPDPVTNWQTVNAGNPSFGTKLFSNIATLAGIPVNLSVDSLDGTFEGTDITGDISTLDTSAVTSAVATFYNSTINPGEDISGWDVANVTNMARMFENAVSFNNDISAWDVSNVTNMSRMFSNAYNNNTDLSAWAPLLTGVKDMGGMFEKNIAFNQDLTLWDVSTVENMDRMFFQTTVFNQDLGDWDVSSALTMNQMFMDASVFDQDISNWCVSLIPTAPVDFSTASPLGTAGAFPVWGTCPQPECGEMYFNSGSSLKITGTASAVGQIQRPGGLTTNIGPGNFSYTAFTTGTYQLPTDVITKLSFANNASQQFDFAPCFYTGNITDMSQMFFNCRQFNGDIANWNLDNVTNTFKMFENAHEFDSDISAWNMSGVTDSRRMFMNARKFNQDISGWDMSSTVTTQNFFRDAYAFNRDLPNWDLSSAKDVGEFFWNATAFNGDISNWNVSNAENFLRMFSNAINFNGDISAWNTASATNMVQMFDKSSSFNGDIGGWDVGNVTNMNYMFDNAIRFNQDINTWNVGQVANMVNMFRFAIAFNQSLNDWDVTGIPARSQMANMFRDANAMQGDISNWCVGAITSEPTSFDYNAGFENNTALLPGWGGCPITDPTGLIINNFNGDRLFIKLRYTSNTGSQQITTPSGGTISAYNNQWNQLTELGQYELPMGVVAQMWFNESNSGTQYQQNVDFTFEDGFYTGQITNMYRMFFNSTGFNGNVTNWDTSKVTTTQDAFKNAYAFNGDVSNWNVSNVQNFMSTFNNATAFESDLSGWDVSKGTNFRAMFYNAPAFNSDLSLWDVSNAQTFYEMFRLASSFNSYLNPWDVQNVTNMRGMFNQATAMQGDISNWCVSQFGSEPVGFDTGAGFEGDANLLPEWGTCKSYNGIFLVDIVGGSGDFVIGGVADDNTVRVRRPDGTLQTVSSGSFAHKYNQQGGWYEIQNMESLSGLRFFDNDLIPGTNDISDGADWYFHPTFDTSNLTETRQMFREAKRFNSDISMFDLTNVTNMAAMFRNAEVFSQDITGIPTANVNNMANMFRGALAFNQQIQPWEVYNVTDMGDMFRNAGTFNQDLSEWCVPLIGTKPGGFDLDGAYEGQTAIQPGWGTCPNAITILSNPTISQVNGTNPAPYAEEILISTAATKAPASATVSRYEWQVSADGATGWAAIPVNDNATADDASYYPNGYDKDQYVRVVVYYKMDGVPEVGAESNALQVTGDDPPVEATTSDTDAKVIIKDLGETLYGSEFLGVQLLGSDGVTTYGYLQAATNDTYVPANQTPFPVVKFNTSTGDVDTSQEMDNSVWRPTSSTFSSEYFNCGTVTDDGRHLLGAKYLQDYILYDYNTNTQTLIPDPHGTVRTRYGSMIWSSVTNKAYVIPRFDFLDFVEIDTTAGTAVKMGYPLNTYSVNVGWAAACEGPNGKIYCLPTATTRLEVAELDPSTGVVEYLPTPHDTARCWSSGERMALHANAIYVSESNCIYGAPTSCLDFLKLDFDNLDGNGKPTITMVPSGQTLVPSSGYTTRTYSAGLYKTPAGNVVSLPSSGASSQWVNPFIYLDTATDTTTTSPNTFTNATYSSSIWNNPILCQNGKVTAKLVVSFSNIGSDDYWFPLVNTFDSPAYDHRDPQWNHTR